jgi:hypothetical protein
MEVSGQPRASVALPPGRVFYFVDLICCNNTESIEKQTERKRETKCPGKIYTDLCFEVLHRRVPQSDSEVSDLFHTN